MSPSPSILGFEEVLEECGVDGTTLSSSERTALDTDGYVVFENVLDTSSLSRFRESFESSFDEILAETGTRHTPELEWTDSTFEVVCTNDRVLGATFHILQRPFRLFQLSGRDPLPGFGLQGLHADWLTRSPGSPFVVVTALWLLDDFTKENGATRIVPGSHLNPRPMPKSMQAPKSHHPDERVITARAGSVLVLNGHLWHSGRKNESESSRRVLQSQFIARDMAPPGLKMPKHSSDLSAKARYFLSP